MTRQSLLDAVEPYRQTELDDLSRMYDCAKQLGSESSREKVRLFSALLEELKLDEEKLNAFVSGPEEFLLEHPRYATILPPETIRRLRDLGAPGATPDRALPPRLEPLRRTIFAALSEHQVFRKAVLASVCLSIVFATLVSPSLGSQDWGRGSVFGRQPASVTLVRGDDGGDRLILPYKGAAEQERFLKATALSKLARDIYNNPAVAKLFCEDPRAYLDKIGLSGAALDPNDYEVKFALFLGTDAMREMVKANDAKAFTNLAVAYLAANPGVPARPEACTLLAVCLAVVLVGGYNGIIVANWVAGAITLVAAVAIYAWTSVGGPGGAGGCFLADTRVNTQPGAYRSVQHLGLGDMVASYNEAARCVELAPVANLYRGRSDHYYVLNDKIRVTGEHPFLVGDQWRKIRDIAVGDMLRSIGGDTAPVVSLRRVNQPVDIFNLTVHKNHTYFVNDSLVHNKPAPIAPGSGVSGGDYASMLKPGEAFAIECARKVGGEQFSAAVFAEIYKKYIEEAKRNASTDEQRRMLKKIEEDVNRCVQGEPVAA